jgi:RNA polymerase primary sigma factor
MNRPERISEEQLSEKAPTPEIAQLSVVFDDGNEAPGDPAELPNTPTGADPNEAPDTDSDWTEDEVPAEEEDKIGQSGLVSMLRTKRESYETSASTDLVRVYLKEIGKTALLSAEEEVEVAKRIEAGEFAAETLNLASGGESEILGGESLPNLPQIELGESIASNPLVQRALRARRSPALRRDLQVIAREGEGARQHLMEANLRLVVSVAKRYTGHGLNFLDLIQEGNVGLIRAVEKFDYSRGYKFSTYATWWIRQAVTRALYDKGQTIREPVHYAEKVNKMGRITRELESKGEEATDERLAKEMSTDVERIQDYREQARRRNVISLDLPVNGNNSARFGENTFGDFIADPKASGGEEELQTKMMKTALHSVLKTLPKRDADVICRRFGIGYDHPNTLDEIGRAHGLSRERIRQIERETLIKLRQPARAQHLRGYVNSEDEPQH